MKVSQSGPMWAAIRRTDGREWIDPSSISGLRSEAERKSSKRDKELAGWASANRVVRISEILLQER